MKSDTTSSMASNGYTGKKYLPYPKQAFLAKLMEFATTETCAGESRVGSDFFAPTLACFLVVSMLA